MEIFTYNETLHKNSKKNELKNSESSSYLNNFWSESICLLCKELIQQFSKEISEKQKKANFI